MEFLDLHWLELVLLLGAFPALGMIIKHVLDEHPDTNAYWGHARVRGEFIKSVKYLNYLFLKARISVFGLLNSLILFSYQLKCLK
jgi:hypothetical protein